MRSSTICAIGIPREERHIESVKKLIFKNKVTTNFPKMVNGIKSQIQKPNITKEG